MEQHNVWLLYSTEWIKQGGVLSPLLFAVYIDELLRKLQHSGYGCTIGHIYPGAFGYADDISLASPTIYGLKQMYIPSVGNMLRSFDIWFNPAKFYFCTEQPQTEVHIAKHHTKRCSPLLQTFLLIPFTTPTPSGPTGSRWPNFIHTPTAKNVCPKLTAAQLDRQGP